MMHEGELLDLLRKRGWFVWSIGQRYTDGMWTVRVYDRYKHEEVMPLRGPRPNLWANESDDMVRVGFGDTLREAIQNVMADLGMVEETPRPLLPPPLLPPPPPVDDAWMHDLDFMLGKKTAPSP